MIQWVTASSAGFFILVLLLVGAGGLALFFKRKADGLAHAEWMVNGGQFELAPKADVDGVIELAETLGKTKETLAALTEIRQTYGHQGVRVGHVMWLVMLMHGDIPAGSPIPSFELPKK